MQQFPPLLLEAVTLVTGILFFVFFYSILYYGKVIQLTGLTD